MIFIYPYENFLIFIIIYLSIFLLITLILTTIIIITKRNIIFSKKVDKKEKPKYKIRKTKKWNYSEILGQKVVEWMIEVSKSDDKLKIEDRINKIIIECERLNSLDIPEDRKKFISIVLLWAKKFNIERHIREIKEFNESSQIIYDKKKNDFKLMIVSES